ncbi:hypothetical protein [Azospirillum doebereinerae]
MRQADLINSGRRHPSAGLIIGGGHLAGMPAAIKIFAHPMIRAVESPAERVSRKGERNAEG